MSESTGPTGTSAAQAGDGTWVVFLHGQPGSASDWDTVITELPPEMHALSLDRPGYRDNPNAPQDLTGNAQWLLDVMDDRGIDKAILVGHSYGGGVALAAAAIAPDRISGLALVSSIGPDCLDNWDVLLASPIFGPICAVFAWWFTPWLVRRRLARIERRRGRPFAPDEHVNWAVWGNARHTHGAMWRTFLHEQRALVHGVDQLDEFVDRVDAPTVVIADPADRVVPLDTARELRNRLAGSSLVLTTGGGHHLPRRKPSVVAREIANLDRALGGPGLGGRGLGPDAAGA